MVDLLGRLSRSRSSLVQIDSTHIISSVDEPAKPDHIASGEFIAAKKPIGKPARRRPRQFADHELLDIVQSYQAGERIIDLAARYDVHRGTVIRTLREQGVPKYTGWTDETTAEAVRLYEQGLSTSEVAARLDRPQSTVWWHLKQAIELRPPGFQ